MMRWLRNSTYDVLKNEKCLTALIPGAKGWGLHAAALARMRGPYLAGSANDYLLSRLPDFQTKRALKQH